MTILPVKKMILLAGSVLKNATYKTCYFMNNFIRLL